MKYSRASFYTYLILVLLFIFSDIISDNYVYKSFNELSVTNAFIMFFGLTVAQILFSPIQAGLSDVFGKKQSLLFSLSTSLIALVFIYLYISQIVPSFWILLLALLVKGPLGNTTPLSWASIADTQDKNYRFSFGLSTSAFAIAYLALIQTNKYFNLEQSTVLVILLFFIVIICCALLFRNIKSMDSSTQLKRGRQPFKLAFRSDLFLKEIKESCSELKNKHIRNAFSAFILWEISLYSILLLYVDFDVKQFSSVGVSMMVGYVLGICILKFVNHWRDSTMIKIGYFLSVVSLLPFLFAFPFISSGHIVFLTICYFFHSVGNAFLCSTIFALLAKEKKVGDHSVTYGLMASADTIAFFISSIIAKIYKDNKIDLIYIIIFSFVAAAVSWFPYKRYMKSRGKASGE